MYVVPKIFVYKNFYCNVEAKKNSTWMVVFLFFKQFNTNCSILKTKHGLVRESKPEELYGHATHNLSRSCHFSRKVTKCTLTLMWHKMCFKRAMKMLLPSKCQKLAIFFIFEKKIEVGQLHEKLQAFVCFSFFYQKMFNLKFWKFLKNQKIRLTLAKTRVYQKMW